MQCRGIYIQKYGKQSCSQVCIDTSGQSSKQWNKYVSLKKDEIAVGGARRVRLIDMSCRRGQFARLMDLICDCSLTI